MPVMGGAPNEIAENITRIQKYVMEHSPHGIPVLFHCEALAGTFIGGSCQFPLPISLGAAFAPELVEEMASINRRQMQAVGIRHALSPVVDVARDLRWGRLSETYGGDPLLCGAMGSAYVRGMQSEEEGPGNAATLKHFLGYSATAGGLNMARTQADPQDMRENFARPFEMAVRNGVKGIMSSYSEYNGKPVCASREVLTDLLRDDLGFSGVVVSDYASVERLPRVFRLTDDMTKAGEMCLEAGMDMEFPQPVGYTKKLAEDADAGKFDMAYIDRSVERVLTLKYELGLFDNPFPRPEKMAAFDNTEHNRESLAAAKAAMTLTKNDGILPLTDRSRKIAVIGPMGSTPRAFYGCYTLAAGLEMSFSGQNAMAGVGDGQTSAPGDLDLHAADDVLRMIYPEGKTTLEGLQARFENVIFAEGCRCKGGDASSDAESFDEALRAAADADVVIMALGGRNGWGTYSTSGEGVDSTEIGLPGRQEELLRAVYAVNPRIVLVHTDCRPVVGGWIYEQITAILEAWLPCTYGGEAIAATITGENNPGGRLPVDVPRSSSHGPVAYYMNRGTESASFARGAIIPQGYVNSDMTVQLPFGYGLSYTSFAYSGFTASADEDGKVKASVTVTNTGKLAGDEVVQLYGTDEYASAVRPAKSLLGFKRITLDPGESRKVTFAFNLDIFAFRGADGRWIVEAGDFTLTVGGNSRDAAQAATVACGQTRIIDHRSRCMLASAEA